jgi:hypothetical protein
MEIFLGFVILVAVAIVLLKGFDKVAGRGPNQIQDGVNQSGLGQSNAGRVPCPECAEMILPAAKKCPFCRSELGQ